MFLIGVDYINKHPGYPFAFQYFRFGGLITLVTIIGAAMWAFKKYNPFKKSFKIRGIGIYFLGVILAYLIIRSNGSLVNFKNNSSDHFHFLFLAVKSSLQIILLILVCRSAGHFINKRFFKKTIKQNFVIDIAIGVILLATGMFVCGIVGFLNLISLSVILLLLIAINPKFFVLSIKDCFFNKFSTKGWNFLGYASAYFIFFFLILNFVSIQSPFPAGFDSRNYYINISKLVAEQQVLIGGYPPYSASLIISIGFILFNQVELALSLSFTGIVLSAITGYKFAVDKLKFNKNRTLFLLALFLSTPAIVNQMFVELKVDYWLLFFQLLIVYYLFDILPKLKYHSSESGDLMTIIKTYIKYALIIGLLLGFGMGIKMINLFLVLVVLVLVWWDKNEKVSVLSAVMLALSVFIIGGIDKISGLDSYHLSSGILKSVLPLAGLGLIGYQLFKNRWATIRKIVFSVMVLVFTVISVGPWLGKNLSESKSLDPTSLMMGTDSGSKLSIRDMLNNYENSKK